MPLFINKFEKKNNELNNEDLLKLESSFSNIKPLITDELINNLNNNNNNNNDYENENLFSEEDKNRLNSLLNENKIKQLKLNDLDQLDNFDDNNLKNKFEKTNKYNNNFNKINNFKNENENQNKKYKFEFPSKKDNKENEEIDNLMNEKLNNLSKKIEKNKSQKLNLNNETNPEIKSYKTMNKKNELKFEFMIKNEKPIMHDDIEFNPSKTGYNPNNYINKENDNSFSYTSNPNINVNPEYYKISKDPLFNEKDKEKLNNLNKKKTNENSFSYQNILNNLDKTSQEKISNNNNNINIPFMSKKKFVEGINELPDSLFLQRLQNSKKVNLQEKINETKSSMKNLDLLNDYSNNNSIHINDELNQIKKKLNEPINKTKTLNERIVLNSNQFNYNFQQPNNIQSLKKEKTFKKTNKSTMKLSLENDPIEDWIKKEKYNSNNKNEYKFELSDNFLEDNNNYYNEPFKTLKTSSNIYDNLYDNRMLKTYTKEDNQIYGINDLPKKVLTMNYSNKVDLNEQLQQLKKEEKIAGTQTKGVNKQLQNQINKFKQQILFLQNNKINNTEENKLKQKKNKINPPPLNLSKLNSQKIKPSNIKYNQLNKSENIFKNIPIPSIKHSQTKINSNESIRNKYKMIYNKNLKDLSENLKFKTDSEKNSFSDIKDDYFQTPFVEMPNDVDINTFKTEGNYEYSNKYKKNKFPYLYDNNNNFDFSYPLSSRNNNNQYLYNYNSNNINYDSINNLKENYSLHNLHFSNSANNVNSENKIYGNDFPKNLEELKQSQYNKSLSKNNMIEQNENNNEIENNKQNLKEENNLKIESDKNNEN